MKAKILGSILIAILGLGILYYFLPYNYQWRIAQWPLAVGGQIDSDFGDVLIVPGAGCYPGKGTEERLNLASALYRQKRRKLIISEGYCALLERQRFYDLMTTRWQIDTNDVIWDTLSSSTEENIVHSAELAASLGLKSAILCTSPFHQLRCKVLMEKYWNGDYKLAKMDDSMLEMVKEKVYVNRMGKTITGEYLKTFHHFVFL